MYRFDCPNTRRKNTDPHLSELLVEVASLELIHVILDRMLELRPDGDLLAMEEVLHHGIVERRQWLDSDMNLPLTR